MAKLNTYNKPFPSASGGEGDSETLKLITSGTMSGASTLEFTSGVSVPPSSFRSYWY